LFSPLLARDFGTRICQESSSYVHNFCLPSTSWSSSCSICSFSSDSSKDGNSQLGSDSKPSCVSLTPRSSTFPWSTILHPDPPLTGLDLGVTNLVPKNGIYIISRDTALRIRREDIKAHKNGKTKTKRNKVKMKAKKINGRRKGGGINRVAVAEKKLNSPDKLGYWRKCRGNMGTRFLFSINNGFSFNLICYSMDWVCIFRCPLLHEFPLHFLGFYGSRCYVGVCEDFREPFLEASGVMWSWDLGVMCVRLLV